MIEIDVSRGFELGCFHYGVRSEQEDTEELRARQRFGEAMLSRHFIRVSTEFEPAQYHNTFIHESIEAINEIYCNGKIKHDEITNCANGLAQIIKSLGVLFVYQENQEKA